MRIPYFAYLCLAGVLAASALSVAGAAEDAEIVFPAGKRLRAFGSCEITRVVEDGVVVYRFRAETPERAANVAHKFMADLLDTGALAPDGFVETRGGQAFAIGLEGKTATFRGAPSRDALAAHFAKHPDATNSLVREPGTYPAFLDRFGWGVYGVGGLENFHGWMGRDGIKDPVEDLDYLKGLGFHFDNHLDPTLFDTADGIMRNTGQRWKAKYAIENGIPYSHRVYVNAGGFDWTARRFPEYMEQPAKFLQSGWHGHGMVWRTNYHLSWFAPEAHNYLARKTQLMMQEADTPQNRGWMHPHGELVHDYWYDLHADFSPGAHAHWQDYLRQRGVTLPEASKLFRRPADSPFQSFEQVPVPEFATFAGLPGRILDLEGEWFVKMDLENAPANDPDWWTRPYVERYPGLREQWYGKDVDTSDWRSIRMPGSEDMYSLLQRPGWADHTASTWFRRSFGFNRNSAAGQRVFLYFFPISHDWVHSGDRKLNHGIFLNGVEVGRIGQWGALDVTDHLRHGANDIAIQLFGGTWNGRIFLSTDVPHVYPDLPDGQNRLWDLWMDWRLDAKHAAWERILNAMRLVEPDKPIKFMAPLTFGVRRWMDLATRFGGFPHFTGEGSWYFPWYKRYGKLYGIPGTSELSGPAIGEQDHYVRRVFLAGLDGHEPVFVLQTYSRDPETRKYWTEHQPLFDRMGKYDIYGPQVLLYRTSKNIISSPYTPYPPIGDSHRPVQPGWNWDLGRGSLQTIGQSYLYLDDFGLFDGKAQGFPLMIDGGNEVMTPEEVDGLRDYVEDGGIYVAIPFTGRSTPHEADAWPIRPLTGVRAAKERPLGGKVTFVADPAILKNLAGRAFDDTGRCVEHMGRQLNRYSLELEADPGVEVLATFENGAPAVTWRPLGRGGVLAFGSVFWRDAADVNGLWWPEPRETDFLSALLDGLGFPQAWCESSDRLIWPQPYRSNNGLDFVTVLVNWHQEGVQRPTITLRPPSRPSRIFSYGVDGVRELPFRWEDGRAVLEVEMPSREVKVIAAEAFGPEDTIRHWWARQNEVWPELPAAIDTGFERYDQGKWADPTQDLSRHARFTNDAPDGDAWTRPGFDDAGWTPSPLDVFNFWGAKENAPVWARVTFEVKPEWKDNGMIRLIVGTFTGPLYLTDARLLLNGVELHDYSRRSFNEFEVQQLLRDGENVLAFAFRDGAKYVGILGNTYLYHRPKPLRSLDLSGAWTGVDGQVLTIPGRGKLAIPSRDFFVPEAWRGRYQIRWHAIGEPGAISGVRINGHSVRRHSHNFGRYCDIDITRFLRYGEENRLELFHTEDGNTGRRADLAHDYDFESLRLDFFPPLP